ncbi:MAG TPA: PilZ domain-containing protein [Nitrospiria bacterium]
MERRRKHKRVKVSSIGEVLHSDKNRNFKVRLGDIGLGGVEIFSEKQMEVGEAIKLKVTFLAKKGENLVGVFSGTLRWMNPYNKAFLGGIQFDEVIDENNHPEFFARIIGGRGLSI